MALHFRITKRTLPYFDCIWLQVCFFKLIIVFENRQMKFSYSFMCLFDNFLTEPNDLEPQLTDGTTNPAISQTPDDEDDGGFREFQNNTGQTDRQARRQHIANNVANSNSHQGAPRAGRDPEVERRISRQREQEMEDEERKFHGFLNAISFSCSSSVNCLKCVCKYLKCGCRYLHS